MKIVKLKKGGRFMARWPETQFYYWSTLLEQVGDNWKVQFADGTIAQVKESDLHESLPADARNRAGRVTRSSPIKNLKRPEEIRKSPARKSPARKVRKLFTKEDNIKLGAELSAEIADSAAKSGDSDAGPSLREQSVSMSKATEDSEHGATDDSSPSRESSISVASSSSRSSTLSTSSSSSCESLVGVSVESKKMTHYENPSLRERSVSVSRERAERSQGAAGVQPSPLKSSYTVEVQKEHVTRNENPYLRERSVSVSRERADRTQGAAGFRPSPLRSSFTVEVQKETVTRNTTSYTESYLDRDWRRQLWKDGSIGSADLRSSPMKGSDSTHDVKTYAESISEKDFRRQLFQKEGSVGSANLRPSPIRGSYSLLTDRGKVTTDLRKYTESYLDRDISKQLGREGSVGSRGILPSTNRRSVSVTKENKNLTGGIPLPAKYSLKDNEKKYLNKYPMEFGGRFGTFLLILLLPLYIMSVFLFNLVPDPTKFEVLLPKRILLIPQVAFGVIMLLSLQAILTKVPIGAVASGPLTKIGILSVRCNGIFAVVLTLILTTAACYFEREVAGIVLSVYTEAAVSALLLGIIIALILYKRANKLSVSYLNPYGSTGFKLYDFWMGREVTPSIGKFNIKLIVHRFSVIIAITLNVLIVIEAYLLGVKEDILKSLMVSTVMQTLYCLHFLLHEDIYLYSFLALSEGVGYMITVGFMTYPFLLTLTTKVILDYRLKASLTEMCIALFGYTVGYVLLESSSNRKTRSVRDPTTSVWKMKVVPEWSASVHTRAYLGEIIIYWAFAMLAGTTYLGVFTIPAGFTFSVLSRALREYTRYVVYQREVNAKKF